jgi:GT2 family glycosyltransferase
MTDTHYWFCTLFDRNYLFKGLTLYRSLERCAGDFTLFVLCMDDESYETLSRLELPKARLVRLEEFEDAELRKAKATRSAIEYFWTCTPSLPLFVLDREPQADAVTYLDADLFFFGDPKPLFDEMGPASIMIHEHRFPPRFAHFAENGIYNVSWVSFRRDDRAFACLRRWREQCNEWCYYRLDNGRLGDQKYLDTWPREYEGVHVLQHKGGGLAPWNLERYDVRSGAGGRVFVDEDPLVFYHFHGLRLFDDGSVQRAPTTYPLRESDVRLLYDPYVDALRAVREEIERVAPGYRYGIEKLNARSVKEELVETRRDRTVHVLIPVHNRLEYTRECLRCFEQQDYSHINVVVIDDGSTDGTSAMLAREFPRVTVLRGGGNLWWTGAMWRGVRHVLRTARPDDYVLCINNDTIFERDYVSTLVGVSREHGGALVGSLQRSWTDRSLISIGPLILWSKGEVHELARSVEDPERLCEQETVDMLDALPGRGTLVPVRVFRRIGNFRRWLLPHYAADYEFAARAKRRGEKLLISTRAAVYTAPDAPRSAQKAGMRETLRSMFSRRSSSNLIDHLVLFAVSGPLRHRPRAILRVFRDGYVALRNAVRTSRRNADAANAAAGAD